MFSEHNERIKHIYGNFCFWAWLRYWYIDSVNKVTMILMDKSFYDYEYEKVESPTPFVDWEDTVKSEEEVEDMLKMFHIGQRKPETLEDIQNYIIKEEKYDGS